MGSIDLLNRLEKDNTELRRKLEYYESGSDVCDIEIARLAGQVEAWELARKIACLSKMDRLEIFKTEYLPSYFKILKDFTYPEAAAKIEEWERQKEICVGDIVCIEGKYGVVIYAGDYIKGITENGTDFCVTANVCTKTGRHIDVEKWLAQIKR